MTRDVSPKQHIINRIEVLNVEIAGMRAEVDRLESNIIKNNQMIFEFEEILKLMGPDAYID